MTTVKVVDLLRLQINALRTTIQKADLANIKSNLAKTPNRLVVGEVTEKRVAIVGYAPSLKKTWELLKDYNGTIISTSGAHDYLIDRGIVPNYHVDCDPRIHKARFTEHSRADIQYLIASSANAKIVDQLLDRNLKLWNMEIRPEASLDPAEREVQTYGDVGQMAVMIAKILGFRKIDLFGMDYSFSKDEHHAGEHGREDKTIDQWFKCGPNYFKSNIEFIKNLMFFELLIHENNDLEIQVYGNGLLSHFLQEKYGSYNG